MTICLVCGTLQRQKSFEQYCLTKNDAQSVIKFEPSQTLEQTITNFKAATTAQDRQALVGQVITAWANTSSLGDAKARNPLSANSLLSSGGWYGSSPATKLNKTRACKHRQCAIE